MLDFLIYHYQLVVDTTTDKFMSPLTSAHPTLCRVRNRSWRSACPKDQPEDLKRRPVTRHHGDIPPLSRNCEGVGRGRAQARPLILPRTNKAHPPRRGASSSWNRPFLLSFLLQP